MSVSRVCVFVCVFREKKCAQPAMRDRSTRHYPAAIMTTVQLIPFVVVQTVQLYMTLLHVDATLTHFITFIKI